MTIIFLDTETTGLEWARAIYARVMSAGRDGYPPNAWED